MPFLFQHPEYVWRQYAAVPAMLATRAGQQYEWQHVFTLFATLGWTATRAQETVIRGASAVFVLFLCWRGRQRAPDIGVALVIYALATCCILLFGSGTERNTYAMMTPVVGLVAATAWDVRDRRQARPHERGDSDHVAEQHAVQHAFPHTVLAMAKPVACLMLAAGLCLDRAPLTPRSEQARRNRGRSSKRERAPGSDDPRWDRHPHSCRSRRSGRSAHGRALCDVDHRCPLGLGPVTASAIGCTVGAIVNYALNYHVTFGSRSTHRYSVPRFALIAATLLLLNTLLMAIGVRLGLHYLIAQIFATGVVLFCNFLMSRIWAFSERPRGASP